MGYKRPTIAISIIVAVLIAVGLAVFFCYPRNPSVEFGDPTYSNITRTSTFFSISVVVPFTVNNPNYFNIKMSDLQLDVEYNGIFIGTVNSTHTYTFDKRASTNATIGTTISTSDRTLAQEIESSGSLPLSFAGTAKFKAVVVTVNKDLSFQKTIDLSQLNAAAFAH